MEPVKYRKVPVSKNAAPHKTFFMDINLEFTATSESEAKEFSALLAGFLEAHDVTIISEELTVEQDGVQGSVLVFKDDENEADAALRKLTENKGNKLWIEYLQTQLKAARGS